MQCLPSNACHCTNVPFALVPDHAFANSPLDYQTSVGLKLWEQGTKALLSSYNLDSNGTVTFIEELKQWAIPMGWTTHVLTISVRQPGWAPAIKCPLLSQYGLISVDNICKYTLTYVSAQGSWSAQHNMMCCTCIMMSLSEKGREKITSEPQRYHVDE